MKVSIKNVKNIFLKAALAAIITSTDGYAFSFTKDFNAGFYWESFPIRMSKFVVDQSEGALLEQLVNESVEEWESATGKDLWEFSPVETTSSFNGNYIRWTNNLGGETGYDPSRTLAVTIRYNQGTFFEQTVILLNGSIGYLKQNWGNSLKATILHEIGHTIGLDHSTANAIMAASLSGVTSLQADDIQGMNAIVDETTRRQSMGFVSPYSTQNQQKNALVPTCASVEDISKGDGPKNGMTNFIGSLLIGVLMVAVANRSRKLSVGVGY